MKKIFNTLEDFKLANIVFNNSIEHLDKNNQKIIIHLRVDNKPVKHLKDLVISFFETDFPNGPGVGMLNLKPINDSELRLKIIELHRSIFENQKVS